VTFDLENASYLVMFTGAGVPKKKKEDPDRTSLQ
jgi:hypothetical protein